jgi:excisionase family DNA binding protein
LSYCPAGLFRIVTISKIKYNHITSRDVKWKYGNMEKLLSIEESAARLGLKPVTVRLWAAEKKLSRVKLGRRVLIPESEVNQLIEENLIPRARKSER